MKRANQFGQKVSPFICGSRCSGNARNEPKKRPKKRDRSRKKKRLLGAVKWPSQLHAPRQDRRTEAEGVGDVGGGYTACEILILEVSGGNIS